MCHPSEANRRASSTVALAILAYLFLSYCSHSIIAYNFSNLGMKPEYTASLAAHVMITLALIPIFALARFSFGYLVSFYMYAIVSGYIWLNHFSSLPYDHQSARMFTLASLLAFLLPALLTIHKDLRFLGNVSVKNFDRLLAALLILSAALLVVSAFSGVYFVLPYEGLGYRQQLTYPAGLGYAINNTVGAILPFCLANFILRRRVVLAVVAIFLFLGFYTVTLTKVSLLAPFWIGFLAILLLRLDPRLAVVMALLMPLSAGLVMVLATNKMTTPLFAYVNFRLIAVPSLALDYYSHFFNSHPPTHFCQISVLKPLMQCPYTEPIGVIMSKIYPFGNFNASFLATEGIASVGPSLRPLSGFVCGIVIAFGNSVSAQLSPKLILLSSSIVALNIMNVPLSTTLLTNGGILLFLLWATTPREFLSHG